MKTNLPILELQKVSKNFGGLGVTHDLSFEVPRGERMALIGPNGAGKTTVFNLVSGVYPVSSGSIVFDGTDITATRSRDRARLGLSRSFQNIRLVSQLTVLENLLIGQHVHASSLKDLLTPFRLNPRNRWKEEARAALADAGLTEHANALVSNLPYGIRKRVDLVRAVISRPKLLMLDEPAAGLNSKETEELGEQLMAVSANGITLLVVEHDMHFVDQLCSHVVVINFGRRIAEGTMAEIRDDPKVREAYLGEATE